MKAIMQNFKTRPVGTMDIKTKPMKCKKCGKERIALVNDEGEGYPKLVCLDCGVIQIENFKLFGKEKI